ncbi:MAG: serine hydrolase [Bacteroidota bacterium]
MIKNLLILIAFLFLQIPFFAQLPTQIDAKKAGFSEERLERYADFLNQQIKEQKLPCGVSFIVRNGVIVQQATHGYRNITTKEAIDFNDIFYIQSMTKPIISVAFMMLYEEGYFELNDPLQRYLPEFANRKVQQGEGAEAKLVDANKPITLAHLLTHTAGFLHGLGRSELEIRYRDSLYGNALQAGVSAHEDIESRAMVLSTLPLVGHPGEQWRYSASPDILALLIQHFTGKTTAEFLQERVFDPLGMEDTGYNVPETKKDRIAGLHAKGPDGKIFYVPTQTPSSGNTEFGGTHGLFSTAADYMKFALMLLNKGEFNGKRLLSRKTVELMTRNHVGELYGGGEGFGLGFGVRTDLADGKTLGSEGQFAWNGANNTFFFIDPEENMVAVLMSQVWPYSDFNKRMFRQMVYQAIDD